VAANPKSDVDRNALVLAHLEVARWVARKMWRGATVFLSRDDAFQEGCLRLLRAAEAYDPARSVSFRKYAEVVTTFGVRKSIRRQRLYALIPAGAIGERPPPPDPAEAEPDRYDALHAAIAQLSPTGRAVLRLVYWEGLSEGDVARRLGMSSYRLHKLLVVARSRLKRAVKSVEV
jgi:RNA polymerase sigma factor (sigma-70 family)